LNTETHTLVLFTQELDALSARSRDRGTDTLQSLRSLGQGDAKAQLLRAGNNAREWNALQAHSKALHAAMECLTQVPTGEDTDTSAEVAAANRIDRSGTPSDGDRRNSHHEPPDAATDGPVCRAIKGATHTALNNPYLVAKLETSEEVIGSLSVTRGQLFGPNGDLALTSRRILFVSSDRKNGPVDWEVSLSDVRSVFYGALATLTVVTNKGAVKFGVNDFDRGDTARRWSAQRLAASRGAVFERRFPTQQFEPWLPFHRRSGHQPASRVRGCCMASSPARVVEPIGSSSVKPSMSRP